MRTVHERGQRAGLRQSLDQPFQRGTADEQI